ncbi:phosphoadenylyl-sulfate reductase [Parvularcula flava]|uniref:Adenosine 5'-phosphosulfate reductase n=1 Tax=Aquisalinus luteolus TaxID=1566827 RepID=A0A8J3A2W1_9PROT|nr:phosphoadenylyl-sulfate reductase [Aquisalinus luteolus]NHK28324.1 phosphoadenylyl-sulfate reductase [Aquisalinus luteolus]GGH98132.1 phosphoadenylyl-sulfate reductase (thioredoxin) [Aquisalinus luteolus]
MSGSVIKLQTPKTVSLAEERAEMLSAKYAGADALEILHAALKEEFPGEIALVSSFGAESAVLLHLAAQVAPDVPVIFLETGKHFAQTLSYRKKLSTQLGLTNVQEIKPVKAEVAEEDPDGDLWRKNPDACCTLRKVRPLDSALSEYEAWITGRKQFHGGARVRLPAFEFAGKHFKVNPIVSWTPDRVDAYFKEHDLPSHPLVAQGFPSIGCWPCTHPVADGEDVRSGRWRGQAKTECGIHGKG